MRPVWDLNPYLEDNQFNIMLMTEPIGIEPIRNGLQPNALPYELRFPNIKSSDYFMPDALPIELQFN